MNVQFHPEYPNIKLRTSHSPTLMQQKECLISCLPWSKLTKKYPVPGQRVEEALTPKTE